MEETDPEEIIETIQSRCDFSGNRVYVLMGIARKKFNEGITNSQEVIYRKILDDDESAEWRTLDLLQQMDRHDLHFRLYLTVNGRDAVKAYFNFMQTMMDWQQQMYEGHEPAEQKVVQLGTEWRSELHKPRNRDDKYFQFDLDDITHGEYLTFVESLPAQDGASVENPSDGVFRYKTQTPNGYHVITDPFNYNEWESPVEYDDLDTDGQVFIAEIDNQ